ncbi:hypothetical protein [Ferruginibacter sp. HRS2-29]|uniref:hypothetical protein n=1 Tax=Ferruginibacter sp. HRS2-29 TaxID=2487334 RepID=UPI0020CCE6D0|nr:hypothetical protein [Ferruginibacter sp. HRS2-29]MCP9749563.1 hypothetical protein [Ferruginibacter sp. HRS2-29]
MKRLSILVLAVALLAGCNYVTYNPKGKKKQRQATPSVLIFDRMVDFRIKEGGWPSSMEDFKSKDIRYYEVVNGFPYQNTEFKIKDSNNMVFYFSNHISDMKEYDKTQKVDLNSYNGNVRFWKEGDKFLWKIKMN